jgi:hypothetical protein
VQGNAYRSKFSSKPLVHASHVRKSSHDYIKDDIERYNHEISDPSGTTFLPLANGAPIAQWDHEYEWDIPFNNLNGPWKVLGLLV